MTSTRRLARSVAALFAAAAALAATGGCSVVRAVHALETGNKALNNLTKQLQHEQNTKYAVTYETTGSSPSTVQYAANPPTDFAYITPGTNGSGGQEIIQNSSGFYSCSQNSGSSGAWQCTKVSSAQQNTYTGLFQFYTGAYWYEILNAYSSFAALEGVKITSTTKTVNGFHLQCVVIQGPTNSTQNGNGNGTFCVTDQGILGYVASQGSSSVFEIKSYTASPSPSLFQLPAGATITTLPTGSSGLGGSTTTSVAGATGSTGSGGTGTTGSGTTGTGSTGSTGTGGTGATGTGATGATGNTGNTTTST